MSALDTSDNVRLVHNGNQNLSNWLNDRRHLYTAHKNSDMIYFSLFNIFIYNTQKR